jgi:WD40 repeat protein
LAVAGSASVHHSWTCFSPDERIDDLVFSPDNRQLLTAGPGGQVRVWDLTQNREVQTWPVHEHPILALAMGRDGKQVLSAGADGTVKLWDVHTGQTLRSWNTNLRLRTLAYAPEQNCAVTANGNGTLYQLELPP